MNDDRIDKLTRMLKDDPGDAFTTYALAMEYAGQGNTDRAIGLLEQLRTDQPGYIPAYHQLGILYERQGDPDRATTCYTKGIAIARQSGDDHAAAEMQDALDMLS